MVSIFEIAIYTAAVGLSTLAGATVLSIPTSLRSVFVDVDTLGRLAWWATSAVIGGVALLAVILYRWPYMERKITFRQLKGEFYSPSSMSLAKRDDFVQDRSSLHSSIRQSWNAEC